jgi:hypothetical protein
MFQVLRSDKDALLRITFRWFHFMQDHLVGMLYFFNLVNVPVQKGLDAETKKVNPIARTSVVVV